MTLLPDNLLPAPVTDLPGGQARAIEAARQLDLPTSEAEDWRYSRIDDLSLAGLHPAERPASLPDPTGTAVPLAGALEEAAARLTLAGGHVLDRTVRTEDVTIAPLDGRAPGLHDVEDAFTLLNAALAPEPQQVTVRAGARVEAPVVILDAAGAAGELAAPQVRVEVGEHASVTVVHLVMSQPGRATVVPLTEVVVGDGAKASLVTVHALGAGTWAVHRIAADVGRDARLGLHSLSIGGHYSRLRIDATLSGAGSSLDNRGLYMGADQQMHDFRVRQRHVGPHSMSRLTLRGAVRDQSEGVFTGVVRVERGAKDTDGAQDAKHLLLEDGTHVDSVPNLEIEENQVACAHASSIGPIDGDGVFYLESRGLPTPVAIRLIARGFLRDGEAGLKPPALADAVSTLITDLLSRELEAPLVR